MVWEQLGSAATVAQLAGVDLCGLVSTIVQAAATAQRNERECEKLARQAHIITKMLPQLQDPKVKELPGARWALDDLVATLRDAQELVASCQEEDRGAVLHWLWTTTTSGRQADRFRSVQSRIDLHLRDLSLIISIDNNRRLCNIAPSDCDRAAVPQPHEGIPREVVFRGDDDGEKFTIEELAKATNNFSVDRQIGEGMYMGRLLDGREVTIKRFGKVDSLRELTILSPLRHSHIVRLFGCCVKEPDHRLLVYEHTNRGTLDDHLHGSPSSSSPVTTSWKARVEILLGVSRAIEYLHSDVVPPVIHRDIKPSNILLDSCYLPRLSDFGLAVSWDEAKCSNIPLFGTFGYIDPEYLSTGILKPTSDVYNLGVVMLEVLTGRKAIYEEKLTGGRPSLPSLVLPLIEAGELCKVLDSRPAQTPGQLKAVELVAKTAARCLRQHGDERPAMSDVVADLERALDELVRFGG